MRNRASAKSSFLDNNATTTCISPRRPERSMDVTGGNIRDEENMALSVSTAAGQSGAEREVARERMTALRNEIERLRRQLSHLEIEQEQQKHGEHLYVPDSDGSNDVYHEIPAMSFVRNNKCDAASSVENKNIDDRMNIHLQSAAHRHKNINHFNNNMTFYQSLSDRSSWLVALLIFQSCSSFILSHNDALLARHPTIVHFLTMLVGAGGNAGNQASVRVIRGLAVKTLHKNNIKEFLLHELQMATCITLILSFTGFVRAVVFRISPMEILAITCSLAMIVFSSICLGAILPLLLRRLGVDPAHSSTTIQVIMDILGVVFTCTVSSAVLRG